MRILIVDDSDIALAVLNTALTRAGYQVDQASTGEDALQIASKGLHRIVISDWDMPGMNGLTLCQRVREISGRYIYFVLLTSHNKSNDIVEGLSAGADDFIVKPFNAAELLLRVRTGERLLSLATRDAAVFSLAKLAESRDKETGRHLERVRRYSQMLARRLMEDSPYSEQINEAFILLVYETSPLHDIGKVGIPDSVLLKPGKLSSEEFAIMKTHTLLGQETLSAALQQYPDAQFLQFASDIAGYHHERFDGTGYPYGLAGHDIPLCARIVALADVYDALTSKRVYKEPMTHEMAVETICNNSGSHFDPEIVQCLLTIADQFDRQRIELADSELSAMLYDPSPKTKPVAASNEVCA